ncbi:MAG: DUF1223 domain-containing protein [Spirochaetaceae bacterium]|nr:DUF1223 domain-containing protein [Spirochaetaceae bacterium]
MRKTLLALIVTLATLTPAGIAVAGEPFAVVELFTSQGCNSCPGAEAVLRDLSAHARESGLRIIPIEWHVDYWDRLGWPDPFGDPEHSQRQRRYARALGQRGPYTPQIIVNGTTIVRPAQRRQLVFDQAEMALEQPAQAEVTLSAGLAERALDVSFSVSDAPRRAAMMLIVVERGLGNHVPRGENRGKTLRHDEVVRAHHDLGRIGRETSGTFALEVPEDVDLAMASLICIVHDPVTMEIVGAASVDLT